MTQSLSLPEETHASLLPAEMLAYFNVNTALQFTKVDHLQFFNRFYVLGETSL